MKMKVFTAISDRIASTFGVISATCCFLLVVITVCDVVLRYALSAGSVAVQELEWHLYSLVFLLGAAVTLRQGGHVRVDVLYLRLPGRLRKLVDALGIVFFLIPFCVLVIATSWTMVVSAYHSGEGSPDPGGLPYRWIVQAAIPLGFSVLLLSGFTELLQIVFGHRDEQESDRGE
ncbi:MAG: TRAP transporter small permease subunit [Bdellovibrionales bacterium]|nr:TRAP transporter small permease subunit [Bdellovibrionales bacterium]